MKRFGCFSLLLLLLVGGGLFYRAAFAPRVGGVPFSQLPPQTQQQRRASAQKLVEQVETVAREAHSGNKDGAKTPKPFVIHASQDQLNTLLQDRLRTEKFPISDLSVGLSQGGLSVQGTAKVHGLSVPATIFGALSTRNGALRFQIDSLAVTGLPAPEKLRDKAESAIENGLQKAFAGKKNLRIESVETAPGELTLRGVTE